MLRKIKILDKIKNFTYKFKILHSLKFIQHFEFGTIVFKF